MTSEQCKLLNDSEKSELRTMLGFSGNKSSSDASDDNESSDKHNRSSTNDSKGSDRNGNGGADDSDRCHSTMSGGRVSQIVMQALPLTHTMVEVQKTMAPTGTHLNSLVTRSPLIHYTLDRTSFSRVRSLVTSARVTLHTHKSRARFEKAKQHGGAVRGCFSSI